MRTIWLVIKHDVGVILRQRSFWVLTLIVPVLLTAMNAVVLVDRNEPTSQEEAADTPPIEENGQRLGLVDPAGIIANLPPGLPTDLFQQFDDQASATNALKAGEITQFVVIPADYLDHGQVTVYDQDFQIRQDSDNSELAFGGQNSWILDYLLSYNLTGDPALTLALSNPTPATQAEMVRVSPVDPNSRTNDAMTTMVASFTPYIFYFLLLMGSSYLLRSVVSEKENRTVEVLLLSLDPRQLMFGKILAMSVVLIVQLLIWGATSFLILDRGAALLQVSQFTFPPGFFFWAVIFLVLGYLLFATVMAAAGALAPNAREGSQVTWILIVPLLPTLMFGDLFIREPENPLVIALSLFPFSAPSAMVTRLAVSDVPLWQIIVSLAGLIVTTYVFVILAARFFKADNLLSQASFNLKRLATEWRTPA